MKYIWLWFFLFSLLFSGGYHASVSPLSPKIKQRMLSGHSWHRGCPVSLEDLRYLRLIYHDFHGKDTEGEMVVHKEVADEVTQIFAALYTMRYPIRQMRLVSDFKGSDWQSIEADNTSAFNCRSATGSKKWSKHAYGKAIDINPIENPYIARSGRIAHKASLKYRKRVHRANTYADKAVLVKGDKAVQIFLSHGWKWGGMWRYVKDYQHFSK